MTYKNRNRSFFSIVSTRLQEILSKHRLPLTFSVELQPMVIQPTISGHRNLLKILNMINAFGAHLIIMDMSSLLQHNIIWSMINKSILLINVDYMKMISITILLIIKITS